MAGEITERKILLVLKDRTWSNRITSLARGRKITVDQAFSGFQAVHLFERQIYAMVFVDFKLLDMHGSEVLTMYQSWPGTVKDTFLTLTGRPRQIEDIKEDIVENGWEYLAKPYEDLELVKYFEQILSQVVSSKAA